MQRKIKHLQNEIHRKAIAFFTHEFDAIVREQETLHGNRSEKYLAGHIIDFDTV
ncbi:hypothetical protein G9A89_010660 [Geosiphon pyriformis]|nr:hypothetical protein G9A89_010660 [Geosiphon pyriformis]